MYKIETERETRERDAEKDKVKQKKKNKEKTGKSREGRVKAPAKYAVLKIDISVLQQFISRGRFGLLCASLIWMKERNKGLRKMRREERKKYARTLQR